jgi:hypothetical protein
MGVLWQLVSLTALHRCAFSVTSRAMAASSNHEASRIIDLGATMKRCVWLVCVMVLWSGEAQAFDYLEHSYFTDLACTRVLPMLVERVRAEPQDGAMAMRVVALGMACPQRWDRPYCAGDYKQVEGSINRLEEEPARSHDHSITLGDFAALPDHLASWGPTRGYPRAGGNGLVMRVMEWLAAPHGSAGGVIEDVAEDACETGELTSFVVMQADVDEALGKLAVSGEPESVPVRLLAPAQRAPIKRGPQDPAGAYSFDNPHYLDLVLRNHNHFGENAHASWQGFHSSSMEIAQAPCVETMGLDADELEELAEEVPGFDAIAWDGLGEAKLREEGCALVGHLSARRAAQWAARAPASVAEPMRPWLVRLAAEERLARGERVLQRQLAGALVGLVYEGGGLHFLQDGLSAGHMRTIRTRGGLQESRYDHDRDNREGVAALVRTRSGDYPIVAFGDSFLGGLPYQQDRGCDWITLAGASSHERVSDCLIQQQRGWVAAVTMASLIDWALGGIFLAPLGREDADRPTCDVLGGLERWVCEVMPLEAPVAFGYLAPELDRRAPMLHAELPVPPPPFSYEAFSVRLGMNLNGSAPQFHVSSTFLAELDQRANWLTSYRVGIAATLGEGDRNQYLMDFSYNFHWRWAARFLVDMGVFTWGGLRGFDREVSLFAGVGPQVGLTLLPEGWTKTPLEISLLYRVPVVFASTNNGFFNEYVIDGHWLYVGFGLAFMK